MSINAVSLSISYVLSACASVWLLSGISDKHYETPFTALTIVVALYWFIALGSQLAFVVRSSQNTTSATVDVVSPHFLINNLAHFFWVYAFTKEHFLIAELILAANLLNLLMLYFTHRTTDLRTMQDWATVHLPAVGIPLAWALYALVWNGACLFHSHNKSLLPRLIANMLIWEFLLVPVCLLVLYGDWSVALATSLLMLGVGFKQMFHKVVALQWAFAFAIAAIDFTAGMLVMFASAVKTDGQASTPLISDV